MCETVTGSNLGNFLYGYVGKVVGYSDRVLLVMGGVAAIIADTADFRHWRTYFDDPEDQAMISWGIAVFNVHSVQGRW